MNLYIASTFLACLFQLVSCGPFTLTSNEELFMNLGSLVIKNIWSEVYKGIRSSQNYSASCLNSALNYNQELYINTRTGPAKFQQGKYISTL